MAMSLQKMDSSILRRLCPKKSEERKVNICEQLFSAAYATCFGSTLSAVSKMISLKDSSITANVH